MNTSSSARLRPFRPLSFGRYTLLSQLATGGMGEIFLARLDGAQGFEKLCVIKKILPQLAADPEFVERFVGEARTLVKLSHGSIAQVLDMGVHEGEAYMALEYVDGKDLRKVAARARDRQQPLPLPFVLFVMGRVLDALAYAHRKKGDDDTGLNLVHRDISPQNILISYEGEVKVIDFGLAKSRLSAAKTNPSIILGKFLYMSPEQARHQPVDRRSDLYAVGLCLYELISGRNPFDALLPGDLMSAVAQPNIPPLGQAVPTVPPAVSEMVMKALAVDPSRRFQTAEEFRGRLLAILLELDESAGPESVTRSMHELFAAEYQAERRRLAGLKEVARSLEESGQEAARPAQTLPPRTVYLDGPVEPLSFLPTPRTRESGPVREEGETRPGTPLNDETRPGVDVSALEESARGRLRPEGQRGGGSDSETVELQSPFSPSELSGDEPESSSETVELDSPFSPSEDLVAPEGRGVPAVAAPPAPPSLPWEEEPFVPRGLPSSEAPASAPALQVATSPGEAVPAVPPGSETPTIEVPVSLGPVSSPMAEPVPALAPAPFSAPAVEDVPWSGPEQELPFVEEEISLDESEPPVAAGVALEPEDADGLASLPFQPEPPVRPSAPSVPPADPRPRAPLSDVNLEDTQPRVVLDESLSREPRSPPSRPPRSRGSSPSVPTASARPPSSPRMPAAKAPLLQEEESTPVPPPGEVTLRTAIPKRPVRPWVWVSVTLGMLLVGGGLGAFAFHLQGLEWEPPPVNVVPPPQPILPPPPVVQTPDAGTEALAEAAADAPDAGAQAGDATSAGEDLLAPLAVESASPSKSPSRRRGSSRKPKTALQKEWSYTRYAFSRLQKRYGCESLGFVCDRYDLLSSRVAEVGDGEDPALLKDVRQLRRELKKRSSR